MKYLFSLINIFFISLSFYGQNDTISDITKSKFGVVSANKMNVVYRGIRNPISIAVPNCKSFTASGLGLEKVNEKDYILSPGVGLESIITLDIVLIDGSLKKEIHKFRIKNISNLQPSINGLTCSNCILKMSRTKFKNAIIALQIENFFFDIKPFDIISFCVKIRKSRIIEIKGNAISNAAFKEIMKLKKGSKIDLFDFKRENKLNLCYSKIENLEIIIID